MSNEVTIEAMNEVIARFMGMIRYEADDKRGRTKLGAPYFLNEKGRFIGYIHSLEYHTSWDWLMPVVEKIHRLKEWRKDGKELRMFSTISVDMEFDGHYKQSRCSIIGTITYCHNETIPHKYTEIPVPHIWINKKKTAIEATHLAVYQFITWYNDNQQKQTNG